MNKPLSSTEIWELEQVGFWTVFEGAACYAPSGFKLQACRRLAKAGLLVEAHGEARYREFTLAPRGKCVLVALALQRWVQRWVQR